MDSQVWWTHFAIGTSGGGAGFVYKSLREETITMAWNMSTLPPGTLAVDVNPPASRTNHFKQTRGRAGWCGWGYWEKLHVKRHTNWTWKERWWQGQLTGLEAGHGPCVVRTCVGGQQYKEMITEDPPDGCDEARSGRKAGWRVEGGSSSLAVFSSVGLLLYGFLLSGS